MKTLFMLLFGINTLLNFAYAANPDYYEADIKITNSPFIIFINDLPVLRNQRGGSMLTKVPLGQYLQNGVNQVRAELIPGRDGLAKDAKAKVLINLIRNGKAELIALLESNPTSTITNIDFSIKQAFKSVINEGIQLENNDALKKEVFQKYMLLKDHFSKKDVTAVLKILSKKHQEIALLTGTTIADLDKEVLDDYTKYVNDSGFKLFEFSEDKVFLKVYGNGKLAALEVKNGNQPLCFINREVGMAIYIPVYFYRNPENKQLEVIR